MKTMILISGLLLAGLAHAEEPEVFELKSSIRPAYGDCRLKLYPSEEQSKGFMTQEARLKCGTDVRRVGDFEIVHHECRDENPDIVVYEITGRFSCKTPAPRITGLGYLVRDVRSGTGLPEITDLSNRDAVGQCGTDVVRVSDYSYDRVYYRFGLVRMTATAQYECVRP